MKTIRLQARVAPIPQDFLGLVKYHTPRPIRDVTQFRAAEEIVNSLAVEGDNLTPDQADYLDVMTTLIAQYDDEQTPPFKASGVGVLKYLLEEHGQNGDDLAKILKVGRSTAYAILSEDRKLTVKHIKSLCERFGVSADTFMF